MAITRGGFQALWKGFINGDWTEFDFILDMARYNAGFHDSLFGRRLLAQTAVVEREGQLALFIEHAPVAIAMFDSEMRFIAVSRRFLSDYRLPAADEVIGRSHYEVFPDIPQRWRKIHARVRFSGSRGPGPFNIFSSGGPGLCLPAWGRVSNLERVAGIGVGFSLGVTRWGPTRPRSFHLVTTSKRPGLDSVLASRWRRRHRENVVSARKQAVR
jgi:hypothetical protein